MPASRMRASALVGRAPRQSGSSGNSRRSPRPRPAAAMTMAGALHQRRVRPAVDRLDLAGDGGVQRHAGARALGDLLAAPHHGRPSRRSASAGSPRCCTSGSHTSVGGGGSVLDGAAGGGLLVRAGMDRRRCPNGGSRAIRVAARVIALIRGRGRRARRGQPRKRSGPSRNATVDIASDSMPVRAMTLPLSVPVGRAAAPRVEQVTHARRRRACGICSLLPLVATAASRSAKTRSSLPGDRVEHADRPAVGAVVGRAQAVDVAAHVDQARGDARGAQRRPRRRSTAQPLPIEPRSSPMPRARPGRSCPRRGPISHVRAQSTARARGRPRARRGTPCAAAAP